MVVCVAILWRVYARILSNWRTNCDFMVPISLSLVMWHWKLGGISGIRLHDNWREFMTTEGLEEYVIVKPKWIHSIYLNGEFMAAGIWLLVKGVLSSYCSPSTNFWPAPLSPWSCCESSHVLHTRRHSRLIFIPRWAKQTMFYV